MSIEAKLDEILAECRQHEIQLPAAPCLGRSWRFDAGPLFNYHPYVALEITVYERHLLFTWLAEGVPLLRYRQPYVVVDPFGAAP